MTMTMRTAKAAKAEAKAAAGKKKAAGAPAKPEAKLDAKDVLGFLMTPQGAGKATERKPLLCKATPERAAYLAGSLSSMEDLKALLAAQAASAQHVEDDDSDEEQESVALMWGRDVEVDPPFFMPEGEVTPEDVDQLLDMPLAELVVVQPQRVHDGLWQLVARLEAQLGCLVGCTAHLCPPPAQLPAGMEDDEGEEDGEEKGAKKSAAKKEAGKKDGQGKGEEAGKKESKKAGKEEAKKAGKEEEESSEDEEGEEEEDGDEEDEGPGGFEDRIDVASDVWACQAQGTRRWRVWTDEEAEEPLLDATLQAGDVLFIPSGCSYSHEPPQEQAEPAWSSHLLLSTSMRWTWASLTHKVVQAAARMDAAAPLDCLDLTLPLDLQRNTTAHNAANTRQKALSSQLAGMLRGLAELVEAESGEVVDHVTQRMTAHFMGNRLPPHPSMLPDTGAEPGLDDCLVARGEGLFTITPVQQPGSGDDEDEDEFVVVVTPCYNPRSAHMMHDDDGDSDAESEDGEGHSDDDDGHHHHHHHHEGECCHAGTCGDKAENGAGATKAAAGGKKEAAKEEEEQEEEEEGEEDGEEGDSDDMDLDHLHDSDEDSEGMAAGTTLPGPVIQAEYAPAVAKVLACTQAPGVRVRDLIPLLPHKDESEALNVAFMLWKEGFTRTLPSSGAATKKQAGKEDKQAGKRAGQKRAADNGDAAQGSKRKAKGGKQ